MPMANSLLFNLARGLNPCLPGSTRVVMQDVDLSVSATSDENPDCWQRSQSAQLLSGGILQ